MFYTVYKITNLINNKIYIGLHKTKDLNDGYMGSGIMIKRAIKKHGVENFKKEILFIFDNYQDMLSKEIELVTEEFCIREDTYNMARGGGDGWSYANRNGLNRTEWHKINNAKHMKEMSAKGNEKQKLLAETNKEWLEAYHRKLSLAAKEFLKINDNAFKGKKHTDETKRKIGEANSIRFTGEANPQFGTVWIYSLQEKKSKKIDKDQPIPQGWLKGRKLKFD